MGYYTRYNLVALPKGSLKDADILNCLYHANPKEGFNEYSSFAEWAEEPKKWYDYIYDMIHLSQCHPNTTFILTGVGEEQGDIWKCYYKDGCCVQYIKAVLTFEENPILPEAQAYEINNETFPYLAKINKLPSPEHHLKENYVNLKDK